MRKNSHGKQRTIIGWTLISLSVLCCFTGFFGWKQGIRDQYTASGREGVFTTPEPPGGTISVNFANREELTALPGIGETMAQAIIDEREENYDSFMCGGNPSESYMAS